MIQRAACLGPPNAVQLATKRLLLCADTQHIAHEQLASEPPRPVCYAQGPLAWQGPYGAALKQPRAICMPIPLAPPHPNLNASLLRRSG